MNLPTAVRLLSRVASLRRENSSATATLGFFCVSGEARNGKAASVKSGNRLASVSVQNTTNVVINYTVSVIIDLIIDNGDGGGNRAISWRDLCLANSLPLIVHLPQS